MTDALVRIEALHKRFGANHVLRGIDLAVARGEVVCIIGPSGSGKSTLLRCVNMLETPSEGKVYVDGVELTDPDCDLDRARTSTGMVFQSFNLFAHMSVMDNITIALRKVLKQDRATAEAKATKLLTRVGLAEKAASYPAQLSGGQQQRVAIARALAMEPKVMLFDEATSALDSVTEREVMDAIRGLTHSMTIVIVAHRLQTVRHADLIVHLEQGRIAGLGSYETLHATSPAFRELARYSGEGQAA